MLDRRMSARRRHGETSDTADFGDVNSPARRYATCTNKGRGAMATTAQSLLALYGELDQAVIGSGDAEIEATVERYLPGSTGGNAGWYDQLLGFLGDRSHRVPEREFEEPPA